MINTASDARAVVQYSRFPPVGIRGQGGPFAHFEQGQANPAAYVGAASVQVMVQIETKEAVRNVDEICAVEGVGEWESRQALCGRRFGRPVGKAVPTVRSARSCRIWSEDRHKRVAGRWRHCCWWNGEMRFGRRAVTECGTGVYLNLARLRMLDKEMGAAYSRQEGGHVGKRNGTSIRVMGREVREQEARRAKNLEARRQRSGAALRRPSIRPAIETAASQAQPNAWRALSTRLF
jgi:hypothetical protein